MCREISSAETCLVRPSLQRKTTQPVGMSMRDTTGVASPPPIALASTCENGDFSARSAGRIPWSTRFCATVWSRVIWVSSPCQKR
jgi:hypothetical protein